MKGKSIFTRQEAQEIERLIRLRCATDSSRQKTIRDKMRDIGFYGSDFHINNMTVEKFQQLIKSQQIKIVGEKDAVETIPIISYRDKPKLGEKKTSQSVGMKQGLAPWVGEDPRVLILGTFPGEKSLMSQAYYQDRAHNSFYKIMEALFHRTSGISDKDFLIENHIALWDCMGVAEREGSIDANIIDYIPNEMEKFLYLHPSITTIILNGTGETTKVFNKHFNELRNHFVVKSLSSTSNTCSIPFEIKKKKWELIKNILNGNQ